MKGTIRLRSCAWPVAAGQLGCSLAGLCVKCTLAPMRTHMRMYMFTHMHMHMRMCMHTCMQYMYEGLRAITHMSNQGGVVRARNMRRGRRSRPITPAKAEAGPRQRTCMHVNARGRLQPLQAWLAETGGQDKCVYEKRFFVRNNLPRFRIRVNARTGP
eukprot:355371-Chlamydomonas_euryale.AAC.8